MGYISAVDLFINCYPVVFTGGAISTRTTSEPAAFILSKAESASRHSPRSDPPPKAQFLMGQMYILVFNNEYPYFHL